MPSCDNRCTSGKEGTCVCSCGGANHGQAAKVWDVLKDGGTATIKGSGINLQLQGGGPKDSDEITNVKVWNDARSDPVQTYRSKEEFVKDLGKFIRAGRVDVEATDAYNRRQVNLPADPERSNKSPKLTDKEAQKQIRATGATVTRKDGEYRVNVPGGTEATAYYTDDKADAVGTAKAMMGRHAELNEGRFQDRGVKRNEGPHGLSVTASADATYNWAHRPGEAWPGSSIQGHRVRADFDKSGDLVDLQIDGGKTDSDSLDGTELNAFLDDLRGKRR